jgi:ubiquinone/menaquinone biosynthesis C-methylase UbiE
MRRPTFIAQQSGNPSGLLGRIIAWIMAFETAAQNDAAREALLLEKTDRVLELGFGHGRTIESIAHAVPGGLVAGVDHSPEMLRVASERCAALVAANRVELACCDSRALPYPAGSFDKVLAVHALYFWPNALEQLREAARVLQPSGLLVLGFRPKDDPACGDFPATVYTFYGRDQVKDLLEGAGFADVEFTVDSASFVLARGRRRP